MKIGEIWKYKGKFQPTPDGKRWSDDPYGSWYMERVKINNLDWRYSDEQENTCGQMIAFESLEGESHPMEAIYAMPVEMFIKNYEKDYDASR